ncbi:Diaminohydroxyphosphoribosylaminopyrimidine deaminase / 5-amino-6-(5-phosphoribosylamino)uracil reductase [hydrothermal vent metagenome]|uniref:Diaminohydroxyphosphoribosylaminopyrimidine deaminase / 5-amino-6-(5-phosphoribosylamino)uracil reductase n=1 Tax=hydrothermal vent metagenome TaxID=652676 RepID=A0A3B1DAX6_9ZZZZ
MLNDSDLLYMKRALRLAKKGRGRTAPNPMVGAVVVLQGKIVGEGYHHAAGKAHAEILALEAAGPLVKGATLYTTLEPCCHIKKRTPPCTEALIKSGVVRVVSAMKDPNPRVSGKGFKQLKDAGIQVEQGLLREAAEFLNEVFMKNMETGQPFVTLKAAMTLDGRIATASGESKWISGERARLEVDRLRAEADGVLVGIGTVLADDPMLRLRKTKGKNPIRVVLDPHLKIPLSSRLVETARETPTVILTTEAAAPLQGKALERKGVLVRKIALQGKEMPFKVILHDLAKQGITHLLVEGGGGVNGIALRSGCVDRVIFYISPRFLCGADAKGVVTGTALPSLALAPTLKNMTVRRMGNDIRIEGRLGK